MKTITILTSLVPLFSLTLADDANDPPTAAIGIRAYGPLTGVSGSSPGSGFNQTLLKYANQHPNATGNASLISADLSQPVNTLAPINMNININVSDVVGVYTSATNASWTSLAYSNTVISLSWPPGKGFDVTPNSWNSCLFFLPSLPQNTTQAGQSDTGNCVATLGQSCVNALKTQYLTSTLTVTAAGCGVGAQVVPAACTGILTFASGYSVNVNNVSQNDPLYYYMRNAHLPSDTAPYQKATTAIYPMLLLQKPVNGSGANSVDMSCARAKYALPGSAAIPSTVPGNAATRATGTLSVGFVMGVVVAVVMTVMM